MRTKEEILKEIDEIKGDIELEKSFNVNSGELSFYYYLLGKLYDELKELEQNEKDNIHD